jgi:hypothetical protein
MIEGEWNIENAVELTKEKVYLIITHIPSLMD